MSHNGRQAVWEILKDRRWHRVDDVRESYPQWYSGLVSLVEWGWALDYRAEKKLVRLLPVSPTSSPVLKTLEVLEWARDLPPLPKERDEQDELDALADRPDGHEELQTLGGEDDDGDSGHVAEDDEEGGKELSARDGELRANLEAAVEEAREARRRVREVRVQDEVGLTGDEVGQTGAAGAPARGAGDADVDGEALPDLDRVRDEEGPTAPDGAEEDGDVEPVAARVEGVQEEIKFAAALCTGTLTLDQSHVTQTCGILAVKGSGKSYTAMVIAEEMLEHDLPFCTIDPTGAWWGLRCGSDGDPEGGYPLVVAGGDHGDVELASYDGGIVARYLVERYPTQLLCDLSLMTPDEQHQFGHDFAAVLFHDNRRAMHVFVDEVDEFCLSEDTEVLTRDGWRGHRDVQKSTPIVAYDLATDTCSFQPVERKIVREHSGEMVWLKTRSLDCLMTKDHRAVIRRSQRAKGRWKKYDWTFCEASKIPQQVEVPGPRPVPGGLGIRATFDEIRCLGWLLTDGYIHDRVKGANISFCLTQSVGTKKLGRGVTYKIMAETLKRLGAVGAHHSDPKIPVRAPQGIVSRTRSTRWYFGTELSKRFLKLMGSLMPTKATRRVPRHLIENCTLEQLGVLFQGLIEGDGSTWKKKWKTVTPGLCEEFVDDFQEIATRLGISSTRGSFFNEFGNKSWVLNLRQNKDFHVLKPKRTHYKGLVWDVTVPGGAFVARRNGRVFVTGNCPQRPQDSLEQKCQNAFDRLVRRGRIRGIGLTGITQRSAVWSKNMLSQVGSLIVLKTGAPQDIKAIEGWVAKVMSGDEVKTFLASLGGLKKGEAWYVLPGSKPLARRIRVRKRRTYDSSRTPEVGEDVRDPQLRHVDAGDLRAFLDSRRHEVLAELAENEGEG